MRPLRDKDPDDLSSVAKSQSTAVLKLTTEHAMKLNSILDERREDLQSDLGVVRIESEDSEDGEQGMFRVVIEGEDPKTILDRMHQVVSILRAKLSDKPPGLDDDETEKGGEDEIDIILNKDTEGDDSKAAEKTERCETPGNDNAFTGSSRRIADGSHREPVTSRLGLRKGTHPNKVSYATRKSGTMGVNLPDTDTGGKQVG